MIIEIWPDYDELPAQARDAIAKYHALPHEDQLAMAYVVKEEERRVREIMEARVAELQRKYPA